MIILSFEKRRRERSVLQLAIFLNNTDHFPEVLMFAHNFELVRKVHYCHYYLSDDSDEFRNYFSTNLPRLSQRSNEIQTSDRRLKKGSRFYSHNASGHQNLPAATRNLTDAIHDYDYTSTQTRITVKSSAVVHSSFH